MLKCQSCGEDLDLGFDTCPECGTSNPEGHFPKKEFIYDHAFKYVGFWKRTLAGLIDALIFALAIPLTSYLIVLSYKTKSVIPMMSIEFFLYGLMIFMLVKYGGTPGKLILKYRVVNEHGKYLNLPQALLRQIFHLLYAAIVLIQEITVISSMRVDEVPRNLAEVSQLTLKYGTNYDMLLIALKLIMLLDVLLIAFNWRKRAIHDYIAKSFVVTRDSIPSENSANSV